MFSFLTVSSRDCYVAVSGIPVRRDDHAIIMAKFARDVLNTMSQQLGNLVPILGSSTASLAMRVGKSSFCLVSLARRPFRIALTFTLAYLAVGSTEFL